MTMPLEKYVQIKDNYCIAYLGLNENYLKDLLIARQIIEDHFPGIKVHIVYNDKLSHLINGTKQTLPYSSVKDNFAYVRELKDNLVDNPVEEFLKECNLKI